MRACIGILIICVLAVGCTTRDTEPLGADRQGLAEIHVDATRLQAAGITRVTIETGGQSQDLALNPATGTFDGTVFLPSGTQRLVASAFSGDMLVARSQPTLVTVVAAVVTRIALRILDLTSSAPPIFGPIFDSLSYPTTTEAGSQATFAVSVVAPAGDPVTYAWSSSCPDATFTAAGAATTGWTKSAQGTCTVTVIATSSGFPIAQSFVVVVFPSGATTGALDVSSTLVTAPSMEISLPEAGCLVFAGQNASCPVALASPGTASYEVSVFDWGASAPGTLDVSDDCGGRFGTSSRSTGDVTGFWLPPVAGGLCRITARAVNGDGLISTLTAAVLAHPGTPPMVQPPQLSVQFDNGCPFRDPSSPTSCGPFLGATRTIFGNVFWADGAPGSLTVTDDCAGPQPDVIGPFFTESWVVPGALGTVCTTTVRATNLQGGSTEVAARYTSFL